MQSKPLISILTPCRNAKTTLFETAESVLQQTYPHWEWLLVDDGSKDGTLELIQSLMAKDPRIKLIHNPVAGSPGKSRQLGFEKSQGEYCAFLDADDLWLPEKLERQLQFAIDNHFDFTFHAYRRISSDSSTIGRLLTAPTKVGISMLLSERPIGNLTVLLNRRVLAGLDFPSGGNEDFKLWLKVLRQGKKTGLVAHFLDQDLGRYRIVPGSRGADKKSIAVDMFKIYWADEDLRLDEKLFYFSRYAVSSLLKYSKF